MVGPVGQAVDRQARLVPLNNESTTLYRVGGRSTGPAGPDLTLVVGRNGSGKSSFAEALELLLTGDSRRWYKPTSIWKEGWQNLHHSGETTISAEFDVAGSAGPLSVRRNWAPGAPLG